MAYYDEKYRIRAIEYRKEGHTIANTSKVFKVSESALKKWIEKYEETGEIKNKKLNRSHPPAGEQAKK
ncbi:MAG: helix-turn-helix domain containing protein [Defluviitaleaceae bacterium]|nr:helix-turn-helix domain containing protein [Defluviitaleaceae bacterium]